MSALPDPAFGYRMRDISWKKIYEREYGVQYSEVAVSLFAVADYHFPVTSVSQIVIPGSGGNTAFYIDSTSWIELVEGLNQKYTVHVKNLEKYEKQFMTDGEAYLTTARHIAGLNLKDVSDKELLSIFLDHQDKRYKYSAFAWSAFILNNYVADRATTILDEYLKKHNRLAEKQEIIDSLFTPYKRAAVLELQYQVEKGNLSEKKRDKLYQKYKWLSCLDIHNEPWTTQEFEKQLESFANSSMKKTTPFKKYIDELQFSEKDLEYLQMAKRFVYIKDARDDFRRESVFYASSLFQEIGRRIGVSAADTSYFQEQEIIDFLLGKPIHRKVITLRKQGFVIYLDQDKRLVCLQGNNIIAALKKFRLLHAEDDAVEVTGRVASQGNAKGKVVVVQGIKDLKKVERGNVLVATTTHPDYVAAMRKAVAIVTDEGGITSHAAIVSREFGIPCIVGCKNATTLLKDGDFVEVDAIAGVVKKI